MALVWQKTVSLERSTDSYKNYINQHSTLPRQKPEPVPLNNNTFLHFQRLRQNLIESRKAFLSFPEKTANTTDDTKQENVSSDTRKTPSKKISFKVKKTSSIYRRNPPVTPKITTISANKVAELTKKFNQLVAENSALLEEPKFKKLVKRVNSQRSSDSDRVNVTRNPSVKNKEYGVKVTRKPSIKTKPARTDDKNIVVVKSNIQRKPSIKSCDKNDRTNNSEDKKCVRAKITYLESPQIPQKSDEQTPVRPKTLNCKNMPDNEDCTNKQVSPNTGTVRAAIEIFERRTSECASPTRTAQDTVKRVPKPKVPEKNFTPKTREVIAKNYKQKSKLHEDLGYPYKQNTQEKKHLTINQKTFIYTNRSKDCISSRKLKFEEPKPGSNTVKKELIQVYNQHTDKELNHTKSAEVSYEDTNKHKEDNLVKTDIAEANGFDETEKIDSLVIPNDTNKVNQKTDFEEEKVQIVNIPSTLPHLKCDSKYETLQLKKNLPPKQVLKLDVSESSDNIPEESPPQSLPAPEMIPNTSFLWSRNHDKSPSTAYKIFLPDTDNKEEEASDPKNTSEMESLYDFVDTKINEDVKLVPKESPEVPPRPSSLSLKPPVLPPKTVDKNTSPEEKIYEELNNKEQDNGYEYCESSAKYEDLESKTDDGYEYCASPKDENIYETLPPRKSPPLLPRRQQQEPLPPRPPSRSSYCTIQNGDVVSNCYESIYNPESTIKKELDSESNYESIYGCHLREPSSKRDSLVSSDQQSNSLYGRYFSGFGDDPNPYTGKATSDLSSSDRSDEWIDMSDNEDKDNNSSSIIIVRERQKNKKSSGWSQNCREQWSKTPVKVQEEAMGDSDSDHHYETLGGGSELPHDDDYDSFDTDSESECSFSKLQLVGSGDIANSQLPDPPNSQPYVFTKLAATAGKHMRKLRRNWSLTKNDISRSLSRMTKRKSRTDLEVAGTSKKDEKTSQRAAASSPQEHRGSVELPARIIQAPEVSTPTSVSYQNMDFTAVQSISPIESTTEKPKTPNQADSPTERKSLTGFLSKFRRSMSITAESASEITSNLENKPKSTFYITETIDVDGGDPSQCSETSPDSGMSVSPPTKRNNKAVLIRPQSPPPPAPVQNSDPKKPNKKDKRSTSWYAEVGLFKNTENTIQNQPKKPNTFWYAEVGLYQAQSTSTPSTSSAENSGNTMNIDISNTTNVDNVDIKPSDFINQDNNEEYYNLKNESEYYNSSVKSFSSNEMKKDQSMTSLTPDIQLRLQDEPLYQFYDAALVDFVCKDSASDSDSDGYEEVGNKRNCESRASIRPSAMDLVCPKRNSIAFTRTLWCEVPEVIQSSVLSTLSGHQKKIQEAKFEVVTSEASYLNSLNVLSDHFIANLKNCDNLSEEEIAILFGKVTAVKECSEKLLLDLEKCWQDNILLHGVCDIVQKHAEENFYVYVAYCENQVFLDDTLKNVKERQSIYEQLQILEKNPTCQSLSLYSFLLLPMQRITRWPLLVDAILKRLSPQDSEYITCQYALATLNKIVNQCNEAARKKEREKEIKKISSQLEFSKGVSPIEIVSANRWLIRSGQVIQMVPRNDETLLTFGKRFSKIPLYLFLFNDLLFVTKSRSEGSYTVIHYCPKSLVDINTADTLISLPVKDAQGKHILLLTLLENQDDKTIELVLSCNSESDKERWMEAFSPPKSDDPNETLYECWDCPQVAVLHSYNASQPDELALSRGDVINVLRKMADGWYHGERIRDGQMGWFPANYTKEVANPHVRARNLKQRYRLLALSENYLKSK